MIVVPKPNPLNINRLGHSHSHHYSVPFAPSSMLPSSVAQPTLVSPSSVKKRTSNPINRNGNVAQSNASQSPVYSFSSSHKPSKPRSNFKPSPFISTSPSTLNNFQPKYHRHTNSTNMKNGSYSSPFTLQFTNAGTLNPGIGPEFEMSLDLSDMSPPSTPSPSTRSRTSSPGSLSPVSPARGQGAFSFPFNNTGENPFTTSSFPTSPVPTRPNHIRVPSAPIPSHHHHTISSSQSFPNVSTFERDRYASSTWQNSPSAASLPKPMFIDDDDDVFN